MARALAARKPYSSEHRIIRPDGTERVVWEHGEGIFDDAGRPRRLIGAVQDITNRKRVEEALRESDRRKTEFLAMLSHELRNPLAPIRNSLYVLDRAAPGGEQARRAHAVIDRQVAHMTRLVDELLEATRLTRGMVQLPRERLDLNELVRRTIEDQRSVFARAGVRLELLPAAGEVWLYGGPASHRSSATCSRTRPSSRLRAGARRFRSSPTSRGPRRSSRCAIPVLGSRRR